MNESFVRDPRERKSGRLNVLAGQILEISDDGSRDYVETEEAPGVFPQEIACLGAERARPWRRSGR